MVFINDSTPAMLVVNINCGWRKSIIIIFTKIIFAIELEFTKFTARENFALYGSSYSTIPHYYNHCFYLKSQLPHIFLYFIFI